jgi:hypothetical protein
VAEEGLQVGEDIDFLVLRVLVIMKSRAISNIRVLEVEADGVDSRSYHKIGWDNNAMFLEANTLARDILAVDLNIINGLTLEIEVDLRFVFFEAELSFEAPLETVGFCCAEFNQKFVRYFRDLL